MIYLVYHYLPLSLLCAVVLDAIIGDPETKYHPVRLIGGLIKAGEAVLYRPAVPKRLGGILLVVFAIVVTVGVTSGVALALFRVSTAAGVAWSAIVIYFCLACRSLIDAGRRIANDLRKNDLPAARRHLSWIVSRDTDRLHEPDIVRGTVESLGENLSDAVIAPLFYAFLFGMPGIVLYKTVNTLDSMIGYKSERYLKFGWCAARLDDVLNFVPARIALLLTVAGAAVLRYDPRSAWRTALRYGQSGASPNGGIGICAFAGALHATLGGVNYFEGEPEETPTIPPVGANPEPLSLKTIVRSERLIAVSSIFGFVVGMAALVAIRAWI